MIANRDNIKPEERYPLGYRDNLYIAAMKLENDWYWQEYEKILYYKPEHENIIIPVALACVVIFFGDNPSVSIPMVIVTILIVLFMCHLDNLKLDYDPWVQKERKRSREFRRKHLNMDV